MDKHGIDSVIDHPFFKKSMNSSNIKWISSIDSLLIAKSNMNKPDKPKVAAFDLVRKKGKRLAIVFL